MIALLRSLALVGALAVLMPLSAHANTITLHTYAAGTGITTQYAGPTLAAAAVYKPGTRAPAYSGAKEPAGAPGQPVTLNFTAGQSAVSGRYTASSAVTVAIFTNGGTTPTSTMVLPAQSTQTAFSVTGSNMTKLELTPSAGTVSVDDLTYAAPAPSPAREPASLFLLGTGLCLTSVLPAWRAAKEREDGI